MKRLALIVLVVGGATFALLVLLVGAVWFLRYMSLPAILVALFFYGWVAFAFQHYRQGRQTEFLQLLTTAAESGAPLAPALRAYLRDRPRGALREFWVGTLLFFVLPGYYWVWHRRHSFDRKVERVARFLEQGAPLSHALRATPGVAPRETQLAAAVGESTGQLARCLRSSSSARLATVWLEVLPRFIYPPLLLVLIAGIAGFWALFVFPKMQRIFFDFKQPMPELTARAGELGKYAAEFGPFLAVVIPLIPVVVALCLYTPAPLWYCPGIGRVYRLSVQSRVLRMLAILLREGVPLPEALALLSESRAFPPPARRRLGRACRAAGQGQTLTDSLRRGRLLQPAMVPFVQAAERVRNLPWALTELGDALTNRLVRLLRRVSLVVMPVSLVGVGVLVAFLGLGMFYPIVQLLTRLKA
jgi:type II secretory pathway component PulF